MKTISPFLWFDSEAQEAAQFYVSVFKNGTIGAKATYDAEGAKVSGRAEGSVMTVDFEIEGQRFTALNGGPIFQFTPAISFSVHCGTVAGVQELWAKLVEGGKALMPCQEYPFSKQYGWLNDKFGVSWQLNCDDRNQAITPSFMFTQEKFGNVEKAMEFYTTLFPHSKIEAISRYEEGEGDEVGKIKYSMSQFNGTDFIMMESSGPHHFTFSQATSFLVPCEDQKEIDHYWEKLGEGGEHQPCGWLIDKFGIAWQVIPANMGELMSDPKDPEKAKRAMKAMLQMKKIDMKALEGA
jgi:predicted 3-demethylubiquinone-9 3-methyltransferase (glyoxalase superfamily)